MDVSVLEEECSEDEFAGDEDYYDELVREVIDENPPEEQGIRPEWKEKVGWHRKEDIYTQNSTEGPSDETGENVGLLKDLLTKLVEKEAKEKIQAKKEDKLRKRLAEEMKEKEALKARLVEAESRMHYGWLTFPLMVALFPLTLF